MVLLIYDFSLKDNKGLSDRSAGLEKEENSYAMVNIRCKLLQLASQKLASSYYSSIERGWRIKTTFDL